MKNQRATSNYVARNEAGNPSKVSTHKEVTDALPLKSSVDDSQRKGTDPVKIPSTEVSGEALVHDDDQPSVSGIKQYLASPEGQLNAGDPPRLTRKEKQARKGLLDWPDLLRLAEVWLETNHRQWPELVAAGIVPANSKEAAERL